MSANATARMVEIIRCDHPTCSWQWRHYPEEAEVALVELEAHKELCLMSFHCKTCGARPGQPCTTVNGNVTHRQHDARRFASRARRDGKLYP